MARIDRRKFLKLSAGAAAGAFLGSVGEVFAQSTGLRIEGTQSADLVLKNGRITTIDEEQPLVEAMAVKAGRILDIGDSAEIDKYISHSTRVVNLAGKSISPGMIDAHSHVIGFGQMQLKYVLTRPPEVHSFETLKNKLALAASERSAGEWIVARGFDTFDEGRFPRRWEIDEAVPKHPVLAIHWSGQFGIANTLALKTAGLFKAETEDPYGGKYLRDRTGMPDGVLLHYPAIYSVYHPVLNDREQLECGSWGMQELVKQGITCVHDNFCNPKYGAAYVRLEQMDKLPCRVRVYPYVWNLQHCREVVRRVRRYNGPLVRMQGIKLAVDGYALMYDVPREHQHLAIPMHPQDQFNEIVSTIHRAGFQVDVHAVGDRGVDWTLAAFAKAAGSVSTCRSFRHRIEHFPFRRLDSIKRAAELGVPVCLQPNYIDLKADDFMNTVGRISREYVENLLPIRSFAREGVQLAYGADIPAFPSYSPMGSVRSVLQRKTGHGYELDMYETVSFMEALKHHTLGGAHASFDEKELGTLEKGKLADFVIWNKDITEIHSGEDIAGLMPVSTYVGGKAVYNEMNVDTVNLL